MVISLRIIQTILAVGLGIVALIFAAVGFVTNFRHIEGGFITRKTIKATTGYLGLFVITGLLAILIYEPSFLGGVVQGIILFTFIIGLYLLIGMLMVKYLERRRK
jgi:hypothetical protein